MGKVKNGKAGGKDEVAGRMIKGGGDRVVDWIWRLFNMAFKSHAVSEEGTSTVIIPLYKGKGERTECRNVVNRSWNNICRDPSKQESD